MQELGLSTLYREREDVRHFCGMLGGLAFLPVVDVHEGIVYLLVASEPTMCAKAGTMPSHTLLKTWRPAA